MTSHDIQGPEPVHAGMLTEYMRHNLGQLLKPRGGRSDLEPQQPTLQTQLSGDDEVKASGTYEALPACAWWRDVLVCHKFCMLLGGRLLTAEHTAVPSCHAVLTSA